jgi:glycosyltransferase involved in cell wall biosynthesis
MNEGRQPLITIGLPVFNVAKFLPDTLSSILAQTMHDWEVVVADDGSSDNSLDIVREIGDPRIRVIDSDGRRRGLAVRLNQIARAARGVYLARMDADDLMHPERLSAQINFLRANPDVDVLGCGYLILDEAMTPVAEVLNPPEHERICADPVRGVRLAHPTLVARTDWFRAHPYDERNFRCEDWLLLYQAHKDSRFANLIAPLYFYRVVESFRLRKYAAHKLRNTRLWWDLPRSECSWGRFAKLAVRSVFDIGIYCAACAASHQDKLIALRGQAVSRETVEEFMVAMRMIRNIPVPTAAPLESRRKNLSR